VLVGVDHLKQELGASVGARRGDLEKC
jgi:hypothetical protein